MNQVDGRKISVTGVVIDHSVVADDNVIICIAGDDICAIAA